MKKKESRLRLNFPPLSFSLSSLTGIVRASRDSVYLPAGRKRRERRRSLFDISFFPFPRQRHCIVPGSPCERMTVQERSGVLPFLFPLPPPLFPFLRSRMDAAPNVFAYGEDYRKEPAAEPPSRNFSSPPLSFFFPPLLFSGPSTHGSREDESNCPAPRAAFFLPQVRRPCKCFSPRRVPLFSFFIKIHNVFGRPAAKQEGNGIS